MTKGDTRIDDNLSTIECDRLRVYAKATTGRAAAHELGVALQTLKNHLYTINMKLGTQNSRQAIWEHYVNKRGATYCYLDHRDG